jgi:hypothetical protein
MTDYGCDGCGHLKSAHAVSDSGKRLVCPTSKYGSSYWRETLIGWIDDGHLLGAELHYDSLTPMLICAGDCMPITCDCRFESGNPEEPTLEADPECPICGGSGSIPGSCCLRSWFSEDRDWALEQSTWNSTTRLPAPIIWSATYDEFEWRPRDPAPVEAAT